MDIPNVVFFIFAAAPIFSHSPRSFSILINLLYLCIIPYFVVLPLFIDLYPVLSNSPSSMLCLFLFLCVINCPYFWSHHPKRPIKKAVVGSPELQYPLNVPSGNVLITSPMLKVHRSEEK
jgi:hypothetical protein